MHTIFPVSLSGQPGASNKNLISTFWRYSRVPGAKLDTISRPIYMFLKLQYYTSDTQSSCLTAKFTMGHIAGKPRTLGFECVGLTNKRSIDYTMLGCFSLKVANSSHIVNISPQAFIQGNVSQKKGQPLAPINPTVRECVLAGRCTMRAKERGWSGNRWTVEENLYPCSYKAQHINWFYKTYKMYRRPRLYHIHKRKYAQRRQTFYFGFGQKTK